MNHDEIGKAFGEILCELEDVKRRVLELAIDIFDKRIPPVMVSKTVEEEDASNGN